MIITFTLTFKTVVNFLLYVLLFVVLIEGIYFLHKLNMILRDIALLKDNLKEYLESKNVKYDYLLQWFNILSIILNKLTNKQN